MRGRGKKIKRNASMFAKRLEPDSVVLFNLTCYKWSTKFGALKMLRIVAKS